MLCDVEKNSVMSKSKCKNYLRLHIKFIEHYRFTLSGNRRTTGHETAPPSRKYTKVLTLHLYDIGNIHEITVQNIVFLVFFHDGSKSRFVSRRLATP